MPTANYTAQHPDHIAYSAKWTLIQDVLKGEEAVKAKGTLYLPLENVENDQKKYENRYKVYLQKAKFYNATARTLDGFVGQVFNKQASQEFPENVKYLETDPCGSGITLEQLAKAILANLLSFGRCGLWTDFPQTNGSYTVEDVKKKAIRPVILRYSPIDIINWRTKKRGARTILSLVTLRERVLIEDEDSFTSRYDYRYRILRLNSKDEYTVTLYEPWKADAQPAEVVIFDHNGQPFDEIPFVFGGIRTNDFAIDEPPLYDMASLNIAHYCNSADYEEACFMVGQPTVWYTVLDENWIKNTLGGTVRLGSRGGLPLPQGGSAGILQVQSNTMCKEAMDQKEQQMIALGARIVRDSAVAKTATEVTSDKVSEVSVLAAGARNTSALLQKAFEFAQKFSGTSEKIKFDLSTDFDMTTMTSQMLLAIVTTWQAGLMVSEDVHDIFIRAGFTQKTFEDAKKAGMLEKPPEPVATDSKAVQTDKQASPKASDSV
jgi:hypothetical protein